MKPPDECGVGCFEKAGFTWWVSRISPHNPMSIFLVESWGAGEPGSPHSTEPRPPSAAYQGQRLRVRGDPWLVKKSGFGPHALPVSSLFTAMLPHPLLCFSAHQLHKGGELFLKAQGAFL